MCLFSTGDDFARYMIDCFETMYEEGVEHPKLMSLALHDRLTGRSSRITGLVTFLDHVVARDRVWICTGREIAEHWRRVHPGSPRARHLDLLDVPHEQGRGVDDAPQVLPIGGLRQILPGRDVRYCFEGALLNFGGDFLANLAVA